MTIGVVLLIIGFGLKYIINRRRFNRRSITGIELFHSYEQALITRGIEGMIGLVARALIAFGSLYTALQLPFF